MDFKVLEKEVFLVYNQFPLMKGQSILISKIKYLSMVKNDSNIENFVFNSLIKIALIS